MPKKSVCHYHRLRPYGILPKKSVTRMTSHADKNWVVRATGQAVTVEEII